MAKYKERKQGKLLLLFGDAIETESGARGQAKTPWEGDVLLNFDAMVGTLRKFSVHALMDEWRVGKRTRLYVYAAGDRYGHGGAPDCHDGKDNVAAAFKSP